MKTTLNKIRLHDPCTGGWKQLLSHLGKTAADDEPLAIATIVKSNGLEDALWCLRAVQGHDREVRLYGVWCARQVQHLMTDARSIAALDVAERYAHGDASDEELASAKAAACAALDDARDAARDADRGAVSVAVRIAQGKAAEAAACAAWDAACAAVWAAWAALDAAKTAAAKTAACAAWDAALAAAGATWDAAWADARDAQRKEFLRVCAAIDAGNDPYPAIREVGAP